MSLTKPFSWEYRLRFPILIASQPLLALFVHWFSGNEGLWYAPTFPLATGWIAAAIGTVGILLRIHATTYLHVRVMASQEPDASRFVSTGIYGVIRNPLYLSSLLLFGAYGLFFGALWAGAFVIFHWVRYQRIIQLEESCLLSSWGQEFEDYCRQVPRWLPRWNGFRPTVRLWISSSGVLANTLFVTIWAGIVASACTGNLTWVIPFELAGAIGMAVVHWRSAPLLD